MPKPKLLTKILAITGTVLVWLPVLAPFFFALFPLIRRGEFLFDFLMPAELFMVVLVGTGLLLWAAIRARKRIKLIVISFVVAVLMLFGGQGIAVVTGLASGDIGMDGWQFYLVTGMIICYALLVVVIGIGGILLIRDLTKTPEVE